MLRTVGYIVMLAVTAAAAGQPVAVDFTPEQSGTVQFPVRGLGATDNDYLLTHSGSTTTLDKDFDDNNQEEYAFGNPSTAQDSASYNDEYMFQLGGDYGLRKVRLSDGALTAINGSAGIHLGANTFGIGYDATLNQIGIGKFASGQMELLIYDLESGEQSSLAEFDFDSDIYGTPTGLDWLALHGQSRALVATRDAPGENPWDADKNYILDIHAATGRIEQYFITGGSSDLKDVLLDDGKIALAYDAGTGGRIHVGSYTPYHPYDFDGDGWIDCSDLAALSEHWLSPRTQLYRGPVPDGLAEDSLVNLHDLAALAQYWPGRMDDD